MNVIQILRKTFPSGYMSTWKFGQNEDGDFVAISNRGARKYFQSFSALEACVANFSKKYGYGERVAPPIRRTSDVQQLALAL